MEQIWEQLAGRLEGPLYLRFLLQPMMAALLAVRAGVRDARARRAPYLWTVLTEPGERPQLLRDGFKDVTLVFLLALVLDVVYQFVVFRWVYPVQALVIAFGLAMVPYALLRGPITRFATRVRPESVSKG